MANNKTVSPYQSVQIRSCVKDQIAETKMPQGDWHKDHVNPALSKVHRSGNCPIPPEDNISSSQEVQRGDSRRGKK